MRIASPARKSIIHRAFAQGDAAEKREAEEWRITKEACRIYEAVVRGRMTKNDGAVAYRALQEAARCIGGDLRCYDKHPTCASFLVSFRYADQRMDRRDDEGPSGPGMAPKPNRQKKAPTQQQSAGGGEEGQLEIV